MDDTRSPDPIGQLLRDYVDEIAAQIVVPPFVEGQDLWRHHRARTRRRRLTVLLASVAVAAAIVLAVIYGPRSAQIGPNQVPVTQPTQATTVPSRPCTAHQLTASVAFNQSGTALGAIKLTDTSAQSCSLAGQPRVVVLDGAGNALDLSESVFHQAPDWPPPPTPIVLSPHRAPPQAIVELDWTWCGPAPGKIRFEIRFSGWPAPLVVPNSSISPSGFGPAPCTDSGLHALLAVDDVRGLGRNGIIGPGTTRPAPGP